MVIDVFIEEKMKYRSRYAFEIFQYLVLADVEAQLNDLGVLPLDTKRIISSLKLVLNNHTDFVLDILVSDLNKILKEAELDNLKR